MIASFFLRFPNIANSFSSGIIGYDWLFMLFNVRRSQG
jgi:hypothetical protein